MAYNRKYILKITPIKRVGNSVVNAGKSIVITDPLTIKFDIKREPFAGSCTANIEIYNLQPSTRKKLFLDYYDFENLQKVELSAGYANGKFDLIYRGQIRTCRVRKDQTETVMVIDAFSGLFVLDSLISVSLDGIQSQQQQADKIISYASAQGLTKGPTSYEEIATTRPVALLGNAFALLKKTTKGKAFVDNDEIVVVNIDETVEGDVRVIDDSTGLLGVPERQATTLTVNCIFEPRLKVGQGIEIVSKIAPEFDGQYKIWGVSHRGTIGMASGEQCITTLTLWTGLNLYGRFRSDFGKVITKYGKSIPGVS